MNRARNKRWRLFADVQIQGQLLLRLIAYWALFQIVQVGTIAMFAFLGNGSPDGPGFDISILVPSIVVSSLVLPFVLLDSLKFSNRFAGPMISFRRKMKQLATFQPVEKLYFRPGDFYSELPGYFNEIRQRVSESENSSSTENNDGSVDSDQLPNRTECHV